MTLTKNIFQTEISSFLHVFWHFQENYSYRFNQIMVVVS